MKESNGVTDTYRLYYYQININRNIKSGVVVGNVEANSPASKAGLQKGDVIIKIGNNDIKNISKLKYYLYQYNIGDTIEITFIRNNENKKVNIKIEGNR